jgi:predicted transcriptional regulator
MYRLDKIQQMLGDRQVQAIADATGLSRWTIYNVRKGVGKIRYETVERLSDYFERQK